MSKAQAVDLGQRGERDTRAAGVSFDLIAEGGTRRRHQHRVGFEFGQGELVEGGERMAGGDDHDAVLVEERPGVDIGVVDRKIDDGSVKSLADKLRKERGGRGLDDHHLDQG